MSEKKFSYDSVNFHKTFAPQDSYISKILELADNGYSGTKEEISEVTGIPTGKTSGKVVPHILYARYMGLINYALEKGKYFLSLTDLGKVVYAEDKYLFEDVSKLICHFNICDEVNGAYIWSFIYQQLPIMLNEIVSEDMLKRKYKEYFLLDVDYKPMKKAYSEDGLWSVLNLLDFSDGLSINSTYYNDVMLYVYSYALFSVWDRVLSSEQEITTDQIIMNLKWNKRFGFDEDEMMYALEKMEEINILKLNKQLMPVTVIRIADTDSLLPHLYDFLN